MATSRLFQRFQRFQQWRVHTLVLSQQHIGMWEMVTLDTLLAAHTAEEAIAAAKRYGVVAPIVSPYLTREQQQQYMERLWRADQAAQHQGQVSSR